MKRISQLDGIRGAAVGAVILHHMASILNIGLGRNVVVLVLYRLLHVGWLGVDIFFVLSGFLITGIILKDRPKPNFWRNFYLRRAFRILPAFTVVFVVTLLMAHYLVPSMQISTSYVLAAIFFLANWTIVNFSEMPMLTHLWSLAVEEQFYFLWPQAAKRMSYTALFKLALGLALGSALLRTALAMTHLNPYILYKITPTRMDGLAIGAALAVGIQLPGVHAFLARWWKRIALASIAMLVLSFLGLKFNLFAFDPWSQVLAIPPTVILVAMTIYASVEGLLPRAVDLFLKGSVITHLGRRSYALYLIHEPINVAVHNSRMHGHLSHLPSGIGVNLLLMIAVVAVSLVLTEVSWHLIENPAQKFRHKLGTAATSQGAAV
ncbi:acyltransferase family protein [Terriglobus saanensis]|uniref:Acyltransferase 3 n=1 Tax=Terriglobus saanensis (strain ATCC BAA-1853 / DSM 23119 / SP1PR4) TaxID=401053 RepID=E8V0G8_TERSS|nr:acyltransferase [Terriglobus saanensis]ADV84451.1 acyltransferase 3 [Terriglobus saanensis SP1PR4]